MALPYDGRTYTPPQTYLHGCTLTRLPGWTTVSRLRSFHVLAPRHSGKGEEHSGRLFREVLSLQGEGGGRSGRAAGGAAMEDAVIAVVSAAAISTAARDSGAALRAAGVL